MKQTIPSFDYDSAELFKPVRTHTKLWLIVVCVLALIGFIAVLFIFAQPTPAGVAVSSQPKGVNTELDASQSEFTTRAGSTQLMPGQATGSDSLPSTSAAAGLTASPASQASLQAVSTQSGAQPTITLQNTSGLTDTVNKTGGTITKTVQSVQTGLKTLGLPLKLVP